MHDEKHGSFRPDGAVGGGVPAGQNLVLVLAAAFTGLRWGELVGLRRCDVDVTTGTVYVRRRLAQLGRGGMQEGPPKSAAGVRNVALPPFLVDDLRGHIASTRAPDRTG